MVRIGNLKIDQILSWGVGVIAAGYILLFLVVIGLRIFYPFELEWIEGVYLDEVRWIAAGNFPYISPEITFLPTTKTPVYFYISAGLTQIMGANFLAPRLISVLATLGCMWVLGAVVYHSTGKVLPSLAAAGIYAAGYSFTGSWMDLAKTDSLFMLFVLAAFYVGYRFPSQRGYILSGILFVLAYFTKQVALGIILVYAPISLLITRGKSWLQWIAAGLFGVLGFGLLQILSNGLFSFYTFQTYASHELNPDLLVFWKRILPVMWPAIVIGLIYFLVVLTQSGKPPKSLLQNIFGKNQSDWLVLGFSGALILTSWTVFFKIWTFENGFMPAVAGLALLAGVGWGKILDFRNLQKPWYTLSNWLPSLIIILLLIQFYRLSYDPRDYVPTPEHRSAGLTFVTVLKDLPGRVLIPNHGYYYSLAGKPSFIHISPFGDIVRGDEERATDKLQSIREDILFKYYDAIFSLSYEWLIVDDNPDEWLPWYLHEDMISYSQEGDWSENVIPWPPRFLLTPNPVVNGGEMPLDGNNFTEGWTDAMPEGRNLSQTHAVIKIALNPTESYKMQLTFSQDCSNSTGPIPLTIGWNEDILGTYQFAPCGSETISLQVSPAEITGKLDNLWLETEFPNKLTLSEVRFTVQH